MAGEVVGAYGIYAGGCRGVGLPTVVGATPTVVGMAEWLFDGLTPFANVCEMGLCLVADC